MSFMILPLIMAILCLMIATSEDDEGGVVAFLRCVNVFSLNDGVMA